MSSLLHTGLPEQMQGRLGVPLKQIASGDCKGEGLNCTTGWANTYLQFLSRFLFIPIYSFYSAVLDISING